MKTKIAVTGRTNYLDGIDKCFVNKAYLTALKKYNVLAASFSMLTYLDAVMVAKEYDGLLITGGDDLNPKLFNQEPHPSIFTVDKDVEQTDLNLIKAFREAKKPILGICRGLQIINVAYGGTLIQDLPSIRGLHHNQEKFEPSIDRTNFSHNVEFTKGTYYHQIFGDSYKTNTFHHQAVDILGQGLIASGISEDGIVESLEDGDLVTAVQWHPEHLVTDKKHDLIFKKFIDVCEREKLK